MIKIHHVKPSFDDSYIISLLNLQGFIQLFENMIFSPFFADSINCKANNKSAYIRFTISFIDLYTIMEKVSIIMSIAVVSIISNTIHATNVNIEAKPFDVNSIEYIEEEINFDLGFDTADYLPENFNPFVTYFDLEAILFIEDEIVLSKRNKRKLKRKLPKNFDAYADPKGIEGINYIDENDKIEIDFDTQKHLPEGFNPYIG